MAAAYESLGEVWAVAGAVGPVDVRVYVRGITSFHYGLSTTPQRLLASGVPLSQMVVQNLGLVPIELGNDRGLRYGEGIRIPANSIYANGAVNLGGAGFSALERFAKAALPAAGTAGRLVELTDYDRALWFDDGAQFWSVTGETFYAKSFGAKGDGATDDTAAILAAAAQAKAAGVGSRVLFAPGIYLHTGLDLSQSRGLTFEGTTRPSAGNPQGAELRFTGAVGSAISCASSYGMTFRKMAITYSNPAFAGRLIDARGILGPSTQHFLADECALYGNGARGALSLVDLDQAITSEIRRCLFLNATYGVQGGLLYANGIVIAGCLFQNLTTLAIHDSGQAWVIEGCVFESLYNAGNVGNPGAYGHTAAGLLGQGVTFRNNWFGDLADPAVGSQITFSGLGLTVEGNFCQFTGGATFLKFDENSNVGIVVQGNHFLKQGVGANPVAIDFGATVGNLGVLIGPNYSGPGVVHLANDPGSLFIPSNGNGPSIPTPATIGNATINNGWGAHADGLIGAAGADGAASNLARADHFHQILAGQAAGAPGDAPPDGTIRLDSAGSRIYVRIGGAWKSAVVA